MCFHAALDERSFQTAPILQPDPEEIGMARRAVDRARGRLPPGVEARLSERSDSQGHPIRPLRYYPFPILLQENGERFLRQTLSWGETYASIARKLVRAYRTPCPGVCRYLKAALVQFLPEHLLHLLESYRTLDDLAGAHLGDDHMAGWSIEWNVGAVGGLDEGHLAAREVVRHLPPHRPPSFPSSPIETDPAPMMQQAIRWAYESHCLASGRPPKARPLIVFLEHDDIYGSTVSLCRRLRKAGESTLLALDRELRWQDGRLSSAEGHTVDIAYCDCHLEELEANHPLIQACAANAVALDTSPLARLVLRSKVIPALLHLPRFQQALQLSPHERSMIGRHLAPTYLWCRKTFDRPPGALAPALSAFSARTPPLRPGAPAPGFRDGRDASAGSLVTKVAIGAVYGGSAVEVVIRTPEGYDTRTASSLLTEHLRPLALHHTQLKASDVLTRTRPEIKSLLKEQVLHFLGRESAPAPEGSSFRDETQRLCREVLPRAEEERDLGLRVYSALNALVLDRFGLDLPAQRSSSPELFRPVDRILDKMGRKPFPSVDQNLTTQLVDQLELTLARLRFREPGFSRAYGSFLEALQSQIETGRSFTCADLLRRLLKRLDRFFLDRFGQEVPRAARDRLEAMLLAPFLEKRFQSANPVVFQPYIPPSPLQGEKDLHVMNRIHILFTRTGPVTRLAGTQVFFLKNGKADNRFKMTASLWSDGLPGSNG